MMSITLTERASFSQGYAHHTHENELDLIVSSIDDKFHDMKHVLRTSRVHQRVNPRRGRELNLVNLMQPRDSTARRNSIPCSHDM